MIFQDSNLNANDFNIINNTAKMYSGGVAFFNSTASLSYVNVEQNTANSTGGLGFQTSNITMKNSAFKSNDSKKTVSSIL